MLGFGLSRFFALDVETANADFASVCQVGIVLFEDGRPEWTWQTLLNPEDYFHPWNVEIHGIDEEAVKNAPRFPDVYQVLRDRLERNIVVCHTSFDRAAISQAKAKYGLPEVSARWLDTARVVRRAWPKQFGQVGYGLANVASFCGIEFEHHRAEEDARAAGLILLRAIEETGLSLEDWFERIKQPLDPSRGVRAGESEGLLAGEVAVFTGALSMLRSDAADLAASAGCDVAANVTKKTTLLVVGRQDLRLLEGHQKSSKHRKAEALRDAGQSIRILGEHDFERLVGLT